MTFLRPLLVFTKLDHRRNAEIREIFQVQNIVKGIRECQRNRLPKLALYYKKERSCQQEMERSGDVSRFCKSKVRLLQEEEEIAEFIQIRCCNIHTKVVKVWNYESVHYY
jgi:hypothetical protein